MSERDERNQSSGGPRAIVLVDEPVKLTAAEEKLLRRILDHAEGVREEIEALLRGFGRFVLTEALGGESSEAIGIEASSNPVVRELFRRAGGPTLRLNAFTVSCCIRIAGWEKAINDETYKGLDWNRKVLLLPLADKDRIREAAQWVSSHKLSEEATEEYVEGLRTEAGKPPVSRLTAPRARKHLVQLRKRFTERRALPKLIAEISDLPDEEKQELLEELEALDQVFAQLKKALKRR